MFTPVAGREVTHEFLLATYRLLERRPIRGLFGLSPPLVGQLVRHSSPPEKAGPHVAVDGDCVLGALAVPFLLRLQLVGLTRAIGLDRDRSCPSTKSALRSEIEHP